jgi:leucyl-tRNA synthetase
LLSPYAPHLAEEVWTKIGGAGLVIDSVWPKANPAYLIADEVVYPVSFNGKVRFKLTLPTGTSKDEIETLVLADDRTKKQMDGREIRKVIVVPGRIVNIVC